jgi:hypothetical protein
MWSINTNKKIVTKFILKINIPIKICMDILKNKAHLKI